VTDGIFRFLVVLGGSGRMQRRWRSLCVCVRRERDGDDWR
jgi:hypothetical protein